MSIINGFIPLPNWYITRGFTLKLTHRERVLYFTIGVEIFRFPESRETMSKEMTTRGLQAITGIDHSHIAKILNKFQRMGIISVQKSFIKGLSSIVTVISFDKLGAGIATDNKKLVAKKATEVKKSGAKKATYPINLNSKEDLQEDDPDSLLKIDQAIEKKPMKNSLNSLPDILSLYTSSKESNSNNSVINVLPAGPTATGNNKFTALGNILAAASVVTAPAVLSKKAISLGRSILLKKGFSSSEVQLITDRITASMTGKDIKSKDKYFLAACNKEVRKGSSLAGSVHKSTGGALVVRDLQVKAKAAAAVEEKQAPPAVEVIERIKTIAPTELFEVIMTVDSDEKTQKALRFFSSDIVKKEILASHYLAAFKKEFPEIKIC